MSKYLCNRATGPRYRDEVVRTYYCESDRRKKAATLRAVRYSDGREFRRIQYHNGHSLNSFRAELGKYAHTLLSDESVFKN